MYVKYFFILGLLIFSFYYTKEISIMLIYKSNLMNQIKDKKVLKEVEFENAIIENKYIIPGVNGVKVNELESYYKMLNDNNIFSMNSFVFQQVKPEISLEENKNLIIKKGNANKNSVSIVLEYNKIIIDYASSLNMNFNVLVNENNFDKNAVYEQIDNSGKLHNSICFDSDENFDNCINKYLVKCTYVIDNNTVYKYEVSAGDILYVKEITLDNFKYLVRKINYRNIKIIFLSELISEVR